MSVRGLHREVNALYLRRASPSLIHLNVSGATFVCLAQPWCESQRAVTSEALDGPAFRVAHQSSASGFRGLEKHKNTMIRQSDEAATHAMSLPCDKTLTQAWRRQKRGFDFEFIWSESKHIEVVAMRGKRDLLNCEKISSGTSLTLVHHVQQSVANFKLLEQSGLYMSL